MDDWLLQVPQRTLTVLVPMRMSECQRSRFSTGPTPPCMCAGIVTPACPHMTFSELSRWGCRLMVDVKNVLLLGCCFSLLFTHGFKDINQPSLPLPFYSALVSISVFMALSTAFHFTNSPDNSPLSHSVLPVFLLPYRSFQLHISLWKSPSALI